MKRLFFVLLFLATIGAAYAQVPPPFVLPPAPTSITGNAATATALAANGANCSAGQAPLGVDASGAVEGCYAVVPASLATPQTVTETSEAATCNWNNGSTCIITAEANTTAWTLTMSNPVSGRSYAVYVTQQTGGPVPLPTLSPTVTWADGAAPTFSGTNTKHDAFVCQYVVSAYYCVNFGNNF